MSRRPGRTDRGEAARVLQRAPGHAGSYRFAGAVESVAVLRFTRHGVLVLFADGRVDVVERHRVTLS